jgi:hypothetical protein
MDTPRIGFVLVAAAAVTRAAEDPPASVRQPRTQVGEEDGTDDIVRVEVVI